MEHISEITVKTYESTSSIPVTFQTATLLGELTNPDHLQIESSQAFDYSQPREILWVYHKDYLINYLTKGNFKHAGANLNSNKHYDA